MVHLSALHQKVIAVNEIVLYGEGMGGVEVSWGRKGGDGRRERGREGRGHEVMEQRGDFSHDVISDNVTYQWPHPPTQLLASPGSPRLRDGWLSLP